MKLISNWKKASYEFRAFSFKNPKYSTNFSNLEMLDEFQHNQMNALNVTHES